MRIVLALSFLLLAFPAVARRADPIEDAFKKADELIEKGDYVKARDTLDAVLSELKAEDPRLVRYHERTGAAWLRDDRIADARSSFTAALKATQRLRVTAKVDRRALRIHCGIRGKRHRIAALFPFHRERSAAIALTHRI